MKNKLLCFLMAVLFITLSDGQQCLAKNIPDGLVLLVHENGLTGHGFVANGFIFSSSVLLSNKPKKILIAQNGLLVDATKFVSDHSFSSNDSAHGPSENIFNYSLIVGSEENIVFSSEPNFQNKLKVLSKAPSGFSSAELLQDYDSAFELFTGSKNEIFDLPTKWFVAKIDNAKKISTAVYRDQPLPLQIAGHKIMIKGNIVSCLLNSKRQECQHSLNCELK